MGGQIIYRALDSDSLPRFRARGYWRRQFFPHRTYTIPKCAPDAAILFKQMVGGDAGVAYWTLTLSQRAHRRDKLYLYLGLVPGSDRRLHEWF